MFYHLEVCVKYIIFQIFTKRQDYCSPEAYPHWHPHTLTFFWAYFTTIQLLRCNNPLYQTF